MSSRWIKFWVIWTLCVTPVVWSLYHDNGPQMANGKPLAKIEAMVGNVTIRSEGRMIWQKAVVGQDLYNNDLIATEAKSKVTVQFYEGRKLQLSPESVVKLGLPTPLSKDLEISVLKGRLQVKQEEPPPPAPATPGMAAKAPPAPVIVQQIIVKTPEAKVLVEDSAKDVSAEKPAEKKEEINLTKGIDMTALAALSKGPICPPQVPLPAPPPVVVEKECPKLPEPEPVVEKEDVKPTVPPYDPNLAPVIAPSSGEFWTSESLDSVKDQPFKLDVALPKKRSKEKWIGIANISGSSGNMRIAGKAASEHRKLSLTLKDLLASNVIKSLQRPSFAVQTGYSIESDEFISPIEYMAPTSDVFSVRSLATGEGVMIGFDKVSSEESANPWLFVNPKERSRIQVGVTETQDRKKLFGFVRGNSGNVSRADWIGLPSEGAFIVRGEKIVGTVMGSDLSQSEWDRLRKAFGADLIFSGSSYSFIGKKNFDIARLQAQTNKIYLYNRGQFVEVELALLKTRPNTMKFVEGLSTYMFREPTKILSQAR